MSTKALCPATSGFTAPNGRAAMTHEQFEKIHEIVEGTGANDYNVSNPIEMTSEMSVEQ